MEEVEEMGKVMTVRFQLLSDHPDGNFCSVIRELMVACWSLKHEMRCER